MRKLILTMTVTADGFVCGPNHESDWFMRTRDEAVKDTIEKTLSESGVIIMGRRAFENMASYWANSSDRLAAPMNKTPKVVFSKGGGFVPTIETTPTTSPHASTWTSAFVATDLVAELTKLKQQEGNPIVALGGASFVQALVKHGLVDEYVLRIHPVAIGKGISMFATAPQLIDLQLVSSTPFASGIIVNKYATRK